MVIVMKTQGFPCSLILMPSAIGETYYLVERSISVILWLPTQSVVNLDWLVLSVETFSIKIGWNEGSRSVTAKGHSFRPRTAHGYRPCPLKDSDGQTKVGV